MKKNTNNILKKSLNTVFFLSGSLFVFAILLFVSHAPFGAALSTQAGILGLLGWSFVKELFYYY